MSNIHHGFKVSFNSWRVPWSVANELWEQKCHEWPVRIWNDPAPGAARSVKKRCHLMRRCVTRQFSPVCMNERTVPVIWCCASSSGSAPCPWGGSIWTAAGSRIEVRHGPWRCRSSELSTTVQQPATRFVIPNSACRGWEVNIETCTQGWSSGLC